MNLGFFLTGIRDILFNPVKFWATVKTGTVNTGVAKTSIFFPLALLITLSSFFGSVLFANQELPTMYSLLHSLKVLVVIYLSVYLSARLLGEITFPLDLGRDPGRSFLLVVISLVPFFLCQVVSRLFESLQFINILSLYGLYIFYTGSEVLLDPPAYKKMPLLIAAFISFTAIYIGLNLLLTMVTDRFFYAVLA